MKTPSEQKVWRGNHLGFHFRIVHWGRELGLNDGMGRWNYYVFLHEKRIPDFDSLWLEPEVRLMGGSGREWVTYDYSSLKPCNHADFHCGVTYYEKHGEVKGHRAIELGCDYSHLWDHENGFNTTLQDVLIDVEKTINDLNELYPETVKK